MKLKRTNSEILIKEYRGRYYLTHNGNIGGFSTSFLVRYFDLTFDQLYAILRDQYGAQTSIDTIWVETEEQADAVLEWVDSFHVMKQLSGKKDDE